MGSRVPAVLCAKLSRDIYLDETTFRRVVAVYGVEVVEMFDHGDSQAALCRSLSPSAAFLVFRGTEATGLRVVDIVANFRVLGTPWAGEGLAHRGYDAALSRVRFPARRFADLVPSSVPLYLTGHSLGGSLATLYSGWVTSDREFGHNIAGLVTFGAPKAATAEAFTALRSRVDLIQRLTMPGDIAPAWPFGLFAHPVAGQELAPVTRWGPLSRHSMGGYADAVAAQFR